MRAMPRPAPAAATLSARAHPQPIENSNWGNQFSELKGVLTNYEVAQFGLSMQFKAYSIEDVQIEDSCFSIPKDYNKVSFSVYWQKMNEIFAAFLN